MHKLTLRSYFKPHKIETCLCRFSFSARSSKTHGHNKVVLKLLSVKGIHNCVLVLVPATLPSRSSSSLFASQPRKVYFNDFLVRNLHTTCTFYDKSGDKDDDKADQSTSASARPSPSAKQEKDGRRRKIDYTKSFTERNFITPLRAMNEYLLKPSDLEGLRKIQRRSPFEDNPPIWVYLRRDVEQKSIEVWGSQEALQRELKKRQEEEQIHRDSIFAVKRILKEYTRSNMHQEELKISNLRNGRMNENPGPGYML